MSIVKMIAAATVNKSDFLEPRMWMLDGFGVQKTTAGAMVTEATALGVSAYYHAIRSISEDIGKLPFITYRRLKPGKPGKDIAEDHPVHRLLMSAPNQNMSALSFKETLTHWALGLGNGFAEIQFSRKTGEIIALWPIHPSRVEIRQTPLTRNKRRIAYRVHNDNGTAVDLPQRQMFHLHGLGMDGIRGYSVFKVAAQSIGLAIAVEQFGASFFGNGTHMSGAIRHPGKLGDEGFNRLRDSWKETYQGAQNAHKFAILEEGMEWVRMGVEPEAAQFLQTHGRTVEEMSRWFRMHPQKMYVIATGKSGGGGGKMSDEDVQAIYVTDTLLPWMCRWEEEAQRKLFGNEFDARHFAKFKILALLRGSPESRADVYSKLFHVGAMSPNEIREEEDRNPLPNGDAHYVPVNMLPDHLAAEGEGGRPANEERPRQPEQDQTETDRQRDNSDREREQGAPRDKGGSAEVLEAFRPLFASAFGTVLRKEHNALLRAAKRHQGDAEGFEAWLDRFATEQQTYALELLEAPRVSLTGILGNGGDHDVHDVPLTVVRALKTFRMEAKAAFSWFPSTEPWKKAHAGREEELADALVKEFAAQLEEGSEA